MTGWVGIDSRRVLSVSDQGLASALGEASRAVANLSLRFPAVLRVMHDFQAGQPPSALGGGAGRQDTWCWEHERPGSQCLADRGVPCPGEIIGGPSDRTGEAAIGGDRVASDRAQFRAEIRKLTSTVNRLLALAESYPTAAAEKTLVLDGDPGDMWCRACWKDNKFCEPITVRRSTGQPYYRGLCRWCGERSRIIGGDPPSWLVELHHRGEHITAGHLDRATKELAVLRAGGATSKQRRRSKRK